MEEIEASLIQLGVFGRDIFDPVEDDFGFLAAQIIKLGEGFEDWAGADAHFFLDGGEIEIGNGERAVHVKKNGSGERHRPGVFRVAVHQNHRPASITLCIWHG